MVIKSQSPPEGRYLEGLYAEAISSKATPPTLTMSPTPVASVCVVAHGIATSRRHRNVACLPHWVALMPPAPALAACGQGASRSGAERRQLGLSRVSAGLEEVVGVAYPSERGEAWRRRVASRSGSRRIMNREHCARSDKGKHPWLAS
jgi:hypothetical protein